MARHRIHRTRSIAFKRRFVQAYLAGETLHGPAGRHDLSRTPIRIRVEKYETGAFDEDAGAAGGAFFLHDSSLGRPSKPYGRVQASASKVRLVRFSLILQPPDSRTRRLCETPTI